VVGDHSPQGRSIVISGFKSSGRLPSSTFGETSTLHVNWSRTGRTGVCRFRPRRPTAPAAAAIAAAESATWASFARAGIPDNMAIPRWRAYTAADRATIMIDAERRVQNDPQHEARLLWTKIALA
jgi:hypothetical protein